MKTAAGNPNTYDEGQLVSELRQATLEHNEERVVEILRQLLDFDPHQLAQGLSARELESRREVHETVDVALRELILADDHEGEFWKRLILPTDAGVLGFALWNSNARWLRVTGSRIPDTNKEALAPEALTDLGFASQAKALGRFCVSNDGTRAVDYGAISMVLDSRLLPYFTDWLLGTHAQSPVNLASGESSFTQTAALAGFLAHWQGEDVDLAASPITLSAAFERPYRSAGTVLPFVEKVTGNLMRGLFEQLGPGPVEGFPEHPELVAVAGQESAILCPNWRESHVAYRCIAPMLTRLRDAGTPVVSVQSESAVAEHECAADWSAQSIAVRLPEKEHFLVELGRVAAELENCGLDFLFYPELSPSNATAWFATRRLARVQAVGYGFPTTSGSPHMDYFVGGRDVEAGGGEDYCEQLILLPGLGVSTERPPEAPHPRARAEDDDEVRLTAIATHQKLNGPLMDAWNSILRDEPSATLDIFAAMTDRQAELAAPKIGRHFGYGSVGLNTTVPRAEILSALVESDLYLDTYPFGGFNCLVEVLSCGCPLVTLEGDSARNRFGAAILRRLGLPEFLIARDWHGYVASAKRVVRDAGLRADLRARLADREAVLAALTDPDLPAHFEEAVVWMRERGPRAGHRPGPPILIEAGERPRDLCA